jgi:uncharacterized protein (DUF1697 family)
MAYSYIALLRGINVGGHTVKMERLRELFQELDLTNVRSYIASGNIFFDTDESDRERLSRTIEHHLQQSLGYDVPIFLRTITELGSLLSQEPFRDVELTKEKRFCVIFTNELIKQDLDLPLPSSKNDMDLIATNPHEAFVVWHIINGRPPSGVFSSSILPKANTSRFYHTLIKILAAAKS